MTFECPLNREVTVIIVEKDDKEYDKACLVFDSGTIAFTTLGTETKAIVIDGEVMKEDWFSDDHLLIVMAHELGHLQSDSEDELTADQTGFDILAAQGPLSAISLYALEIQKRYCQTPPLSEIKNTPNGEQ